MSKAVRELHKTTDRREGITIPYRMLNDKVLDEAFAKLDQFCEWSNVKDIHAWNKFKNTYDRERKKAAHFFQKLVHKNAHMEEQQRQNKKTKEMEPIFDRMGKPLMKPRWAPDEDGVMDIDWKDPEAAKRDVKIFHDHTFTVKICRFLSEDFIKAGLTPEELRACARLLNDSDPELETSAANDLDKEDMDAEMTDDLAEIFKDTPTPQEETTHGGDDTPTDS